MTEAMHPVETIRRLYALFGEGRLDETFELMDPCVELWEPGDPALLPWAGRFQGHEGVRRFYKGLADGLSEIAIDPDSLTLIPVGDDAVLATGTERGVSRETDRAYVTHSAWLWTVREGRVTRLQAYHDTAAMAGAMTG